ncbi:uncharacterized protein [Littorina saxatilis]|uniref:uncharacterized protein isoform X2 n=1 Tax=Littorina saxatilis TaxID=31220 RepID=UPI0038B612F6
MFEPRARENERNVEENHLSDNSSMINRLGNTDWSECANCVEMEKVEECNCCTESTKIMKKLNCPRQTSRKNWHYMHHAAPII